MTLIESLVLAALHGFSRFVPISSEAHEFLLRRLLHFPAAGPEWTTTFALGALVALLAYFVHDWASILSSFLQVVIYRKRPMTLDERLPFFMIICMSVPFAGLWYVLRRLELDSLGSLQEHFSRWMLAALVGGSILLHLSSKWSKKNQGLFNLGILDSLLFGVGQAFSWIPGIGGTLGILGVSQLRNYHLEAATKMACLMSLPFVSWEALSGARAIQWGAAEPINGTSWFQWALALLFAALASGLALRILTDGARQPGFERLVVYRLFIGAAIAALGLVG